MELWILNVEGSRMYAYSSREKGMKMLEKTIEEFGSYDNVYDFECIVEKENFVYYYSPTADGIVLQKTILDEE